MIEALRFVKGAVAKRDLVQALTHFLIRDHRIVGYNGRIAMSSPIACNIDASPQAEMFFNAIESCTAETSLSMTSNNRLAIKSGKFRAFIPCLEQELPSVEHRGAIIDLTDCRILAALRLLLPIVSTDATRQWSQGVLLRDNSAFATNNAVLAEAWLGTPMPCTMNIPAYAVAELLRIGEEPTHMQVCERSATFFFSGGRWLYTLLYSTLWPDLSLLLPTSDCAFEKVDDTFFANIETIQPFVDDIGAIYILPNGISTVAIKNSNIGANIEMYCPFVNHEVVFNVAHLLLLRNIASGINLRHYPKPCGFIGERMRGAIIGMRV